MPRWVCLAAQALGGFPADSPSSPASRHSELPEEQLWQGLTLQQQAGV